MYYYSLGQTVHKAVTRRQNVIKQQQKYKHTNGHTDKATKNNSKMRYKKNRLRQQTDKKTMPKIDEKTYIKKNKE